TNGKLTTKIQYIRRSKLQLQAFRSSNSTSHTTMSVTEGVTSSSALPFSDSVPIVPSGVYGRLDPQQHLLEPDLDDARWKWSLDNVLRNPPAESILLPAPQSKKPPADRSYPLAQTYHLKHDLRFLRGYRYGTAFKPNEKEILRDRLLRIDAPEETTPCSAQGHLSWDPLPGMIRMIPGVPFTYEMPDSQMVLTIGCLHTPESLKEYGQDGETVLSHIEDLRKITFGCKADSATGQEELKPIYTIPALKRNDRSGASKPGSNNYDGSYSLASTVGEGDGKGCFMPAMQNDTSPARHTIGSALQHLHAIWRLLFPKSVSKMEYDLVEFDGIDNNTFAFGGRAPGPTSLQMNVTSHGRTFREAIGHQASWHTDFHDAPTHWTMAVILLRIPEGSDPGAFLLGRAGLYIREGNILILILFFKGNDPHTGFPPTSCLDRVADFYDTADSTNRVVYVCYPSQAGVDRFANMAMTPATRFGNSNATLAHKVLQRTFATHGEHILGGIDCFANRMGIEAFKTFWNSLRWCNLTLKVEPDELLRNIFYIDGSGREVSLLPMSQGFHPIQNAADLDEMRSYYRWYTKECNRVLILIRRSELNQRDIVTSQDQHRLEDQFLPSEPQPMALLRSPSTPLTNPPSATCPVLDRITRTYYKGKKPYYEVKFVGDENPQEIVASSPWLKHPTNERILRAWLRQATLSNSSLSRLTEQWSADITSSTALDNEDRQDEAGNGIEPMGNTMDNNAHAPPISESLQNKAPKKGKALAKPTSTTPSKRKVGEDDGLARRSKRRTIGANVQSTETTETDTEEYDVEAIVGFRHQFNGGPEWLCKWVGYDDDTAEWRPWSSLSNCKKMVLAYNKKHGIHFTPGKSPVAISAGTVLLLRRVFSSTDLELQLNLLKAQHGNSEERISYYKDAPKRDLRTIAQTIINRATQNNWFLTAYASFDSDSAPSIDIALSQLQLVGSSLPAAAENMKMLKILERAQRADLCQSLIVIYHWYSSAGPGIAENLVWLYIRGGLDALVNQYPRVAALVDLVVRYVRQKFQRAIVTGKRTRNRQHELRALPETQELALRTTDPTTIDPIIPASKYEEYGLVLDCKAKSKTRLPGSIRLPSKSPQLVLGTDESLASACAAILVDLWGSFYIQPHVKAMDPVLSGRILPDEAQADYMARAICRGAILNCVVDAFQSTSILFSTTIDGLLTMPWMHFGPSGDNGKAPRFSNSCLKMATETLTPIFDVLERESARSPASSALADEISHIIYHHALSLSGGVPVAASPIHSVDALTSSGQDSPTYQPQKPLSWGDVTYESIVGRCGREGIMQPIALILREASNERRRLGSGNEILHLILTGHGATQKHNRPAIEDRDLTDPVRRFSISALLCSQHLPARLLASRHGLSNLLAWFGTGQGNMTKDFLGTLTTFFSTSAESLIQKFEPSLTNNTTIRARHGYQVGKKLAQLPGMTAVYNSRIWGQPNNHLSLFSHQTDDSISDHNAIQLKFGEIFTDSMQNKWISFLGDVFDCEDPWKFTGRRPSWYDTVKFISSLGISGFGNGLTTIQCANCLAFAYLVDPPDTISMASWIYSHEDLGAFRGLLKLGFDVQGITSVVAAFNI
ncbi:hypothetical protein EYR36_003217, partial [Pleurotus pulmonarius]